MLDKLLEKLSGRQITAIILALIFVPGAVGAAVTFQPVTIVDPTTGKQSLVDGGRRLYVYDPIAGYRNNPANNVQLSASGGVSCSTAWTAPAGKALIVTSLDGYFQSASTSSTAAGFQLVSGSCATATTLAQAYTDASFTNHVAPVNLDFGPGIVFRAGKDITVRWHNNTGYLYLHGYIVPDSLFPQASALAAGGISQPNTADINASPR